MNNTDIRGILKRKIFERNQGGDELLRRRVINELVSTYALEDVELILAKKRPFIYDPRIDGWIYL